MHITHIIPTLSFGGAERTVVDIINNAGPEFDFSVIVFFPDTPLANQIIRENVKVSCVPKTGKLSLDLFQKLKHTLTELKPDVVHTHLFGADVWGRKAAYEVQIPVVTTEHNINKAEGILKALVKRKMSEYSNQYAACSDSVREYMEYQYGIPVNKVEVVRPGVDLPRFSHIAPSNFSLPLKFVIVGRLVEQKGHILALEALSQIQENWELTIVGNGPQKEMLEDICRTLEIEKRVKFVPALSNVESIYKTHDIVLIPSEWEGLGIVAMEAMASERLVIASDVGGLKEVIRNEKTGFLVPPHSLDFAQKILWCIENRELMPPIAQAGRKYALEHFGVERMVKKYEELYKKLEIRN